MALIDGPRARLAAMISAADRALELIGQGMTAEQAAYVVSLELTVQRDGVVDGVRYVTVAEPRLRQLEKIEDRGVKVVRGEVSNGHPWTQNAEIGRYILGWSQ